MRKRGYWIRQSIAIVISVAMLFSSVELPVLAVEAGNENIITDEEGTESVSGPEDSEQIAAEESQSTLAEDPEDEEDEISTEWNLMESDSGNLDDGNITLTTDDEGTLTVSGTGELHGVNGFSPFKKICEDNNISTIVFSNCKLTGDASRLFASLKDVKAIDLSGLDTSTVTDMSCMFVFCENLTTLDASSLVTDHVTNMSGMFCGCIKLTSLDVNGWDTSKVTDMSTIFDGCNALSNLDVSHFKTGSVTDMHLMFDGCKELSSLNVKGFDTRNVSNMSQMFYDCSGLTSLDISGWNTSGVTDMRRMFYGCSSLKEITGLNECDTSKVENMSYMFQYCSSLTMMDMSSLDAGKVTNTSNIFCNCSNLENVALPRELATIGSYAFTGCSALTGIEISGNVGSIAGYAFSGCSALTGIEISGNVGSIAGYAFSGCSALTGIEMSGNVGSIADDAFGGCSTLTGIEISGNVGSIADKAFNGCNNLADIDISGYVKAIGDSVFNGKQKLKNVTISGHVESMGNNVFAYSGLESVEWTGIVESMGEKVFYSCGSLKDVILPSGLTGIGNSTFYYCRNLENVTISESVTSIGESAFYFCTKLQSVTILGYIENIKYYSFKACEALTEIEFPKGVGSMANSAFEGCTNLKCISISGDMTSIGASAFLGCCKLTDVEILGNVGSIGNGAFKSCAALETVKISGSVECIGDEAFYGCGKLKDITISNGYADLGESAFYGCYELTYVSVPDGVESIKTKAFSSCSTLESVKIAGSVADIQDNAFENCIKMKSVFIPKSVTSIGNKAFYSCVALTDIYYEGTEDDWSNITIGSNNDSLANATIHYGTPRLALPTAVPESGSVLVKGSNVELGAEDGAKICYTVNGLNPTENSTEYTAPISIDKDVTIKAIAVKEGFINSKVAVFTYTVKEPEPEPQPDPVDYGDIEEQDKPAAAEENRTDTYWIAGVYDTEYTGKAVTFDDLRVYYGNKLLTKGTDYTVKYKDNTQVGTASVTITGKGNYSGSKTFTFKITEAKRDGTPIDKATVKNWKSSQVYTGSALTESAEVDLNEATSQTGTAGLTTNAVSQAAGATLTLNGTQLVEGKDYKVEYKGNINVGTATVLFRGIGDYRGTIQKKFKITARSIADGKVLTSECDPTAPVSKSGAKPNITVKHNGKVLKEGKDYTLTFKNNKKVGATASYTIKGKGNFKGSVKGGEFKVVEQSIAGMAVSVPDVTYKNKAKIYKSKPTVCDGDGKKLKAGTDYEKTYAYTYVNDTKIGETTVPAGTAVSDTDIIPAGTEIRVTVKGKGSYGKDSATVSGTFRIIDAAKTIAKATVKITGDVYYTGKPVTLEKSQISVTVKGTALKAEEFEIVPDSYVNNTKKGTAKVTIHGIGAYGGFKTVKFKIKAKSIK